MSDHVLRNEYLTARFSAADGNLVFLAAAESERNLVEGSWAQYAEGARWTSERPATPEARRFDAVQVQASPGAVESLARSDRIEFRRRFELRAGDPLLKVTVEATLTAGGAEDVRSVAFPKVQFTPDFTDAFEDDADLYFDGEELQGGRELPPWRVFFRTGHQEGLLAATRSKLEMSRFQILERGFEIRPHAMVCYDSGILNPPLPKEPGRTYAAAFEIGPWSRARHEALLRAAELDRPVQTTSAPLTGRPLPPPEGVVIHAEEFAAPDQAGAAFDPRRWMLAPMPHCLGGRALTAGPSVRPPVLRVTPGLAGCYRIYVGVGNGDGVVLRLSGDTEPTFRYARNDEGTPFHLRLAGEQRAREVFFKAARMDGQTLEIARFPHSYATTVVNYVRFEKLSDAEAEERRQRLARPPATLLCGFNDVPDIAPFTDARDPDPAAYRNNLWEHANCGIRRVFWRIDGQCSDYPSKVNTMRYTSARVHGIFAPQSKAYGRVLKKTDMLALAGQAARDFGLELYGWMRFNSYMGNVVSDFYRDHPELREEWESGYKQGKLCLAHPEVRQHKIAILVEAAAYGLPGLNLGFLRHPPVLHHAPVLVEGYRARYGRLPPRNLAHPDANRRAMLPETDEEHTRWFQYRAEFLTQFGRELRAALKSRGLGHVKISLWVRPNHCLFDGIDLKAWLDEGLCNEVVADNYFRREVCGVSPEWKRMVQSKAALIRGTTGVNAAEAAADIPQILKEGYDGICFYESDYSVLDTEFIRLFEGLRR